MRRVLKPNGVLILEIQQGNGEGWEDCYVPGVQRFYARYQESEMRAMLSGSGYAVQSTHSAGRRGIAWLGFVCLKK